LKRPAPSAGRRAVSHGVVIEQNNATGNISYWEESLNHSAADRQGISLADYVHAIYGFLRQAKCRDVLMIGCGGGTLATMLRRARVKVVIVDNEARSFDIARRYFHLADDMECHVDDGQAFLRRDPRRYDAIVLDAYGDGGLPAHLVTRRFFELVRARLRPRNSLFLINLLVADDEDRAADRIAWRLSRVWRRVRLLDSDGWEDRNAVAMAGKVSKLKCPRLLLRPKSGARKLAGQLRLLSFRELRG